MAVNKRYEVLAQLQNANLQQVIEIITSDNAQYLTLDDLQDIRFTYMQLSCHRPFDRLLEQLLETLEQVYWNRLCPLTSKDKHDSSQKNLVRYCQHI